jgi:hypothetical protein
MAAAKPKLAEFAKNLPPGYNMEIGGEEESQVQAEAMETSVEPGTVGDAG